MRQQWTFSVTKRNIWCNMPNDFFVAWIMFTKGKLTSGNYYFSPFKFWSIQIPGLIWESAGKDLLVIWVWTYMFHRFLITPVSWSAPSFLGQTLHMMVTTEWGKFEHVFALPGARDQELRGKFTPAKHPVDASWLPAGVHSAVRTRPGECKGAGTVPGDLVLDCSTYMPPITCFYFTGFWNSSKNQMDAVTYPVFLPLTFRKPKWSSQTRLSANKSNEPNYWIEAWISIRE